MIYFSHRLEELYALCQDVTVLRDGRVVHSGPLAGLGRLQLISHMLGRDLAEVRREGLTSFSDTHGGADGEPLLHAEGLTKRHLLHGITFDVRPGEVTGLGGLLGSGRS